LRKTIALVVTIALAGTLGCGGRETAVKSDTGSKAGKPSHTEVASSGTATAGTRGSAATATAEELAGADTSVGQMMPPYTSKLLGGGQFDLAAEKGNVVFLNLWATWCGPCRIEIPELERLHKEHAADRFKVVGVSIDEAGEQEVQDFVKAQQMTYPVALDPEGKLANLFQTTVLPTSVLIDRHGRIVWKKYGQVSLNDNDLKEALEKALKG
jgi:cytochrome c biogenesis protein CcmG/thiol:disulfide interchange protein DsbE